MFNRPLTPDLLWEVGYTLPVWLVLLGGAVVLSVRRRRAPRAWRIGFVTLLGLLLAEVVAVATSEWLVYEATKGSVIPLMVFKYRLMMIASSLIHALALALLVVAIVMDRRPPDPYGDESHRHPA